MSKIIKIQAIDQSDKLAYVGDGDFPTNLVIERGNSSPAVYPAFQHFNAIVTLVRNDVGTCIEVQIDFLGEEKEPEEEQERIPYEVTELGRAMLEEGHPENEREEARIKAVFGLK